ncbi:PREDICTED: auxin-induced protein 15A-like [Camelina sativa]|uniref:Auxin-induced protein 15A-like n=1 Tax=Camelina sativa TaxID=90675 RepID=A0ABM0VFD8_CAMSA|nr:PREDICTED: auxin-induced protein 15A-like [Camelina sativa]
MPNKVTDMHFHQVEEEEEEEHTGESRSSSRTPRGHFVVYVDTNKKLERFVIPTRFLKSPSFQKLLEKAAEEYGYAEAYRNKIVLPCDVSSFRSLVMLLTSHGKGH